jgi:membrane-associated protease RseP (regulator of RpoE activity)
MSTEKDEFADLKSLFAMFLGVIFLVVIGIILWIGVSWGIHRVPDKVRFAYTYVHSIYVYIGNKTGAFEEWELKVKERQLKENRLEAESNINVGSSASSRIIADLNFPSKEDIDRERERRKIIGFKSTSRVGIDPDILATWEEKRLGTTTGIAVKQVARGSPAFSANVLPGDVVLAVGNNSVASLSDYDHLLDKYEGQVISFVLDRNGMRLVKKISIRVRSKLEQSK